MTAQPVSHPARAFAACTHLTMVRVYSYVLRCDSCGNYGPFGWLYRCSQDQEEILRDSILSGDEVTFDELGRRLITAVQPRNRGPERRSGNAACFLEEMPPKDITTTYTSDQLLTIFNQRKHLGEVLRRESFRKKSTSTQGHDGARQSTTYDLDDILSRNISTPWVPRAKDECVYKICPYCRPGGADRAYISLDGVVEGNIPATAATGYGFHLFRQRPVCSSSLVANLGLRPTTVSAGTSASASYHTSSDASTNEICSARPINQLASQLNLLGMANDTRPMSPYPLPHAQLPRSVASPDLAAQVAARQDTSGGDSSWQDTTASTVSMPAGASGQFGEDSTDMEEHEKEEGKFLAQPLEVARGVAVLEESVERHAPDLVTQV
ncbi:hypothetical protein CTA2_6412 [Colletotrichum tanaceti]|uniref:Uncharacterized protein n=1 Tax=Colletotrichum tanaceti TaxID=1306861 RepID=A0A4U6XAN0_9PEZI|nr:hypothetical protein CTA2_6421 [Colletotrichum tanaceti]KAJ0168410.1 hypothetical protein CTA2_6412 [Colletotrichum tanaceti]TKW50747.1 hypothetical protein CTA1_8300 [Colletotrichum tanaceti]